MQRLHQVLSILILSTTKLLDMIDRVFFVFASQVANFSMCSFFHPPINLFSAYHLSSTYHTHRTHGDKQPFTLTFTPPDTFFQ